MWAPSAGRPKSRRRANGRAALGLGEAAVWTSVQNVASRLKSTESLGFHQFLSEKETGN